MKRSERVLDICRVALFAALLSVSAWIQIPTPIPITLQTLTLFTMAGCLSPAKSLLTVLTYLAVGAVGVPVFSGFQGGIAVLLGPTGGFLLGFIPSVLLLSAVCQKTDRKSVRAAFSALSLLILYTCGCVWYLLLYGNDSVIITCVIPFIIPDTIKAGVAITLCAKIKKYF